LAYIPKSTQIHSTKLRRAVERKIDNRTHAVMRLGEKPVKSIASGSAKTQVTTTGHTGNERDGTRPVRPLREAPQNPTSWKTGQRCASTAVSWRDSHKPRTGDEPNKKN
jgi:hypothetical protein